MPQSYTVVQGDCLSSIAAAFGFCNWRTIYDDPANANFRSARPDPNVLYPGDILVIPDKTPPAFQAPTGQASTYTVNAARTVLSLQLDDTGDVNYTVQVDGGAQTPTAVLTAGSVLQLPIPPGAAQAQMLTWPTSFASAGDAGSQAITWTLLLGSLDPIDTVSGIQARLTNLGYDLGAVDGINGPNTQAAIRRFQGDNGLEMDGIVGPLTTEALQDAYGM